MSEAPQPLNALPQGCKNTNWYACWVLAALA